MSVRRCVYCGRRVKRWWACSDHRDLLRLDPYYHGARVGAIASWREERDARSHREGHG